MISQNNTIIMPLKIPSHSSAGVLSSLKDHKTKSQPIPDTKKTEMETSELSGKYPITYPADLKCLISMCPVALPITIPGESGLYDINSFLSIRLVNEEVYVRSPNSRLPIKIIKFDETLDKSRQKFFTENYLSKVIALENLEKEKEGCKDSKRLAELDAQIKKDFIPKEARNEIRHLAREILQSELITLRALAKRKNIDIVGSKFDSLPPMQIDIDQKELGPHIVVDMPLDANNHAYNPRQDPNVIFRGTYQITMLSALVTGGTLLTIGMPTDTSLLAALGAFAGEGAIVGFIGAGIHACFSRMGFCYLRGPEYQGSWPFSSLARPIFSIVNGAAAGLINATARTVFHHELRYSETLSNLMAIGVTTGVVSAVYGRKYIRAAVTNSCHIFRQSSNYLFGRFFRQENVAAAQVQVPLINANQNPHRRFSLGDGGGGGE